MGISLLAIKFQATTLRADCHRSALCQKIPLCSFILKTLACLDCVANVRPESLQNHLASTASQDEVCVRSHPDAVRYDKVSISGQSQAAQTTQAYVAEMEDVVGDDPSPSAGARPWKEVRIEVVEHYTTKDEWIFIGANNRTVRTRRTEWQRVTVAGTVAIGYGRSRGEATLTSPAKNYIIQGTSKGGVAAPVSIQS